MRLTLTLVVLCSLPTIGLAQLLTSTDERRLAGDVRRASKVPTELTDRATLTFVELGVIFDGGSYGATFRRGDGRELVIFFLHPGYWSKQAIKDRAQPIVVQLDTAREDEVRFEVEPSSPFERRLVELLNEDIGDKRHSRKDAKTLTRVRDTIQNRKPLAEIRRRFPKTFQDEQ
jgi:hypothetical protein